MDVKDIFKSVKFLITDPEARGYSAPGFLLMFLVLVPPLFPLSLFTFFGGRKLIKEAIYDGRRSGRLILNRPLPPSDDEIFENWCKKNPWPYPRSWDGQVQPEGSGRTK